MVDGLEADMGESARVVRIDAKKKETPLARELKLRLTPTFVLLDPAGRELYREVGRAPNRARVLALIESKTSE